jgi:hypothetical protein
MNGKRTKALRKLFLKVGFDGPQHPTGSTSPELKRPWRAFKRRYLAEAKHK